LKAPDNNEEANVIIGDRLRSIREEKRLSQGDIEKRTALLRCYASRVENGHTVPAVEPIERFGGLWKSPYTNSFTMETNHSRFQTFPKGRQQTRLHGAVPENMPAIWRGFGGTWRRQAVRTENSCFQ
jgi:transcriptional regulator with XRE-family HTH domain